MALHYVLTFKVKLKKKKTTIIYRCKSKYISYELINTLYI